MRKLSIVAAMLLISAVSFAQSEEYNKIMDVTEDASLVQDDSSVEFPYSKVLNASDNDLVAQRFKYDQYHNSWTLSHTNGWNAVAGAIADVHTPSKKDYKIVVQNGRDGQRSSVQVIFYDSEIYHTIQNFGKTNGANYDEDKVGKGSRYTFEYAGMAFTLEYSYEEVKVTHTTTGTTNNHRAAASHSATNDYSYDKYVYTVTTGVPADSDYLRDQALKDAKRKAKGKKARSAESFM